MTAARWLSLAAATSLLLAASARAGTEPGSPFLDPSICGTTSVDGTLAPVGVFAGSPHCAALCKKTVGQCKAFVRKIVGCYSSLFQIAASFQSQHCADALSTPADVKSCKTIVTSDLRALESGFSATRDSEFTDCETWGSGCAAACAP